MNKFNRPMRVACLLIVTLTLAGCDGSSQGDAGSDEHADGQTPTNPNLISISSAVRSNLGISFVEVERRRVEKTLRVPGRFEYLPSAKRAYRTPLPGRIDLLVDQYDRVESGTLLYRIDSPGWRDLQRQMTDTSSEIELMQASLETFGPLLDAHRQHEESLDESIAIWTERVKRLEDLSKAGGGRIDALTSARATLSKTRAELATVIEKDAELQADKKKAVAGLAAAQTRLEYLLNTASVVTAIPRMQLTAMMRLEEGERPRWMGIQQIEVRSDVAGVVSQLGVTNGAWADETTSVVTVVQPDRLRFRASGLQSDLGVLRDGLTARIVPPTPTATGSAVSLSDSMLGLLTLGLEGDPNDRTIDLLVVPDALQAWARPGVSAQLEIVTDESADAELAIPLAAVQRDGLTPYIFRRTPGNPNQVMRIEADLGRDDGRWVELLSGVADGDEIVLDGAFQLMLSTSGSIQKGGHFHADGTFHEGED